MPLLRLVLFWFVAKESGYGIFHGRGFFVLVAVGLGKSRRDLVLVAGVSVLDVVACRQVGKTARAWRMTATERARATMALAKRKGRRVASATADRS